MELEWSMLQLVPLADPQSFIRFAPQTGLHNCEHRSILSHDSLDDSKHLMFKLWSRSRRCFETHQLLLREFLEQCMVLS